MFAGIGIGNFAGNDKKRVKNCGKVCPGTGGRGRRWGQG